MDCDLRTMKTSEEVSEPVSAQYRTPSISCRTKRRRPVTHVNFQTRACVCVIVCVCVCVCARGAHSRAGKLSLLHSPPSLKRRFTRIKMTHKEALLIHTHQKKDSTCVCVCLCVRQRERDRRKERKESFVVSLSLSPSLPLPIFAYGHTHLILNGVYPHQSAHEGRIGRRHWASDPPFFTHTHTHTLALTHSLFLCSSACLVRGG